MKKQIISLIIIGAVPALAWMAIAGDKIPTSNSEPADVKLIKNGLHYDKQYGNYSLKSQDRFAALPLEQKLQTIQAISYHEDKHNN